MMRPDRPGRPAARLIVVAGLMLAAVLGPVGPAFAHNVLVSSDPAEGSTVTSAPAAVTLTFDQPVQNFEPVVTVTGPNGNTFQTGAPSVTDATLTHPIAAGPPGAYTIAYRVISADGHPVTGEVRFTLAASAAGTATGTPPVPAAAGTGDGGLSWWLWVAIAVAALLVVAAVVVVLRRPRDID